ncbi:MAG: M55 family metallopeptidase [Pirellulales bacterium]
MPHLILTRRDLLRSTVAVAAGAALPCCFSTQGAHAAPSKPLKIFMHWDMEGTAGLFLQQQAWYKEKGVDPKVAEEGIKLLIAAVNSAAAAALAAGVDRLIICDTHGGGGNFREKEMLADPRITYLWKSRGYEGKSLRWMPGMNETVDGLMLMGHHAKAGTPNAFLPHTENTTWADFSINGQSVGEIGIETCFAGYWGVPLILAQGDEAMCKEVQSQFPGAVTACVKRAESFDRATGPDAETARKLTAEKVAEAIRKLRTAKPAPYKPTLPMRVALRYKSESDAESAAKKPGVRRTDAYTVQCEVKRQCDVVKWLTGTGIE